MYVGITYVLLINVKYVRCFWRVSQTVQEVLKEKSYEQLVAWQVFLPGLKIYHVQLSSVDCYPKIVAPRIGVLPQAFSHSSNACSLVYKLSVL